MITMPIIYCLIIGINYLSKKKVENWKKGNWNSATGQLTGRDGVGLGLCRRQQRCDDRGLSARVSVEVRLEAVEDAAAEAERLFLVDHRHEEQDDGGPGRGGRATDRHEVLLVGFWKRELEKSA